jgi:hypothetical protein
MTGWSLIGLLLLVFSLGYVVGYVRGYESIMLERRKHGPLP